MVEGDRSGDDEEAIRSRWNGDGGVEDLLEAVRLRIRAGSGLDP